MPLVRLRFLEERNAARDRRGDLLVVGCVALGPSRARRCTAESPRSSPDANHRAFIARPPARSSGKETPITRSRPAKRRARPMQIRSPRSKSTRNRAPARRSGAPRTRRRRPAARASPPRTRLPGSRATRRAGSPAPSPAIIPAATSDDGHGREPRLRQVAGASPMGNCIQQRGHQSQCDRARAADRDPSDRAARRATVRLSCSRHSGGRGDGRTGGLGNHDLLGRPLDPHADPPRPAVALDHDLSNQGPVDRLGQLELNGQVRLVDRGKRPAIMLGAKPQPARPGRLDPRRAPQEPIADIGDSKRLLRDPTPGRRPHEQGLGMNVQLGRARSGRRNASQPIVELVIGRSGATRRAEPGRAGESAGETPRAGPKSAHRAAPASSGPRAPESRPRFDTARLRPARTAW